VNEFFAAGAQSGSLVLLITKKGGLWGSGRNDSGQLGNGQKAWETKLYRILGIAGKVIAGLLLSLLN